MKGILVGYTLESGMYRIGHPQTGKIAISHNVDFFEQEFDFQGMSIPPEFVDPTEYDSDSDDHDDINVDDAPELVALGARESRTSNAAGSRPPSTNFRPPRPRKECKNSHPVHCRKGQRKILDFKPESF
jgi:hypothetical protein